MILIVYGDSASFNWSILDHTNKEILKTKTIELNIENLDIFNVCNVLHSARDLYKSKDQIKLLLFYGNEGISERNKSNLLLVFKDYFPNAIIRIEYNKL